MKKATVFCVILSFLFLFTLPALAEKSNTSKFDISFTLVPPIEKSLILPTTIELNIDLIREPALATKETKEDDSLPIVMGITVMLMTILILNNTWMAT